MRYLSICSGIEAASAAWMPLGWTPVAFSEIEPFPCSALAHHHPNVPNWGGDEYDLAALRHRMAYLEKEHALIAARHIFGLKGGEL